VLVGGADAKQSKIVGKFNGAVMPGNHGCGGGWFYAVSAQSKNKVAAFKWVELLSTKKYQQVSYEKNGRMPSRQSAYAEAYITSTLPEGFAEQFKLAAAGSFPPPNRFPEDAELQDELDRYTSDVVAGTKTAKQAMDEANQSWEGILKRAGRLA
jgi:multiple sugar transport system substrate-binding protein